jgi:hypothetical protein
VLEPQNISHAISHPVAAAMHSQYQALQLEYEIILFSYYPDSSAMERGHVRPSQVQELPLKQGRQQHPVGKGGKRHKPYTYAPTE